LIDLGIGGGEEHGAAGEAGGYGAERSAGFFGFGGWCRHGESPESDFANKKARNRGDTLADLIEVSMGTPRFRTMVSPTDALTGR